MEYFKDLPVEIPVEILSRLPTETILQCKSVCKSWNHLVSGHPYFTNKHLHRLHHSAADSCKLLSFLAITSNNGEKFHYIEYNENRVSTAAPIERITRFNFVSPFRDTRFVGSCNGLICFAQHSPFIEGPTFRSVCICNPITKEYIMLPEFKIDCCDTSQNVRWTCGFGFVSSTDEYKFVAICMSKNPDFVEVHIYTIGNGWRNFNVGPSELWGPGIFANGALYWIDSKLKMIASFDLSEEKFSEHLLPLPIPPDSNWFLDRIGVLDGLLFCAMYADAEGDVCYGIWLLKKTNDHHDMKEQEDNQSMDWSKEFCIESSGLLAVTKSGSVLASDFSRLKIYDTKASTSKTLVEFSRGLCDVFPHKNTLVCLKELGEEDTKIMKSIDIEETELRAQRFYQL